MTIDAFKFGLATAIVFALTWIICSLFVFSTPLNMMQMRGHMVHADLGQMMWSLSWIGFIVGLVAWPVVAGIMAWGVAATYNRLVS